MLFECLFEVAAHHLRLDGTGGARQTSVETGGAAAAVSDAFKSSEAPDTSSAAADAAAVDDDITVAAEDVTASSTRGGGDLRTGTLLVLLQCIVRNSESVILSAVADFLVPSSDPTSIQPEDALVNFMFQLIEILASHFEARKITTEFHCQEFAQLIKILYSISSDSTTHPRLSAACARAAVVQGESLNRMIGRTICIKPLLAVYWHGALVLSQDWY
jgi:hypothetical protein